MIVFHLVIGVWNLFGIWCLMLGIFDNTYYKQGRFDWE